jgi:hypothetical protein
MNPVVTLRKNDVNATFLEKRSLSPAVHLIPGHPEQNNI